MQLILQSLGNIKTLCMTAKAQIGNMFVVQPLHKALLFKNAKLQAYTYNGCVAILVKSYQKMRFLQFEKNPL